MQFVITGGASGVGEALVHRLKEHEVWILDLNEPSQLAALHHYIAVNLSVQDSIDQALEAIPESIDGLANVAGMAQAPQAETVIAVNFLALRHLSEAVVPRLRPNGRIVNVSSVAGRDWLSKYDRLQPLLETTSFNEGLTWCKEHYASVERDPYTLSKRLVTAYTLRSAQKAVTQGFRVNCVSPGPIETPLYPQFESLMGKGQSEWMKAQAGRAATADDIAQVVDLLLTGECTWLNGVDIPVDGGYTAGMESGWVDFSQSPIVQHRP